MFGLQQSATRRGDRMMSGATELRAVQADRKLQVAGSHLPEIIDKVLANKRNEENLTINQISPNSRRGVI